MNPIPETQGTPEGILEITLKKNPKTTITQIKVFKAGDHYWSYIRQNGQKLNGKSPTEPERMAESIQNVYSLRTGIPVDVIYTPN